MKRLISIFLVLSMFFSVYPVNARENTYTVKNISAIHMDCLDHLENQRTMTEEQFSKLDNIVNEITVQESNTTADTGLYESQLTGKVLQVYEIIKEANVSATNNCVEATINVPYDNYKDNADAYLVDTIYATAMYAYYRDHMDTMAWALNKVTAGYNGGTLGDDEDSVDVNFYFNYYPSQYYDEELGNTVNTTVNTVVNNCNVTDTWKKLKYYHDWIVQQNEYDSEIAGMTSDDGSQAFYYDHSPVGCLIGGKGVCESYAKAFKVFCMKEEIPCLVITSETHAWDYVKLDDQWYMVDCTWDDTTSSLEYFLVSNTPYIDTSHTDDGKFDYPSTSTSAYHVYTSKITSPTCTSKGYTTHTCSICGSSYKDTYVSALGHKYDTGKVTTKATNTTAGVRTYTCSVCGKTKTESISRISSVKLYKGVDKTYKLTSGKTASWTIKSGSSYVSKSGNTLTIKKAGTVKLYDSKSKQYVTIYIKTPTISTKTSVSVSKGKYLQLTATATPSATVKYYVTASKYKKYATVTTGGKVKGIKKGTCYIYAKANGVKKKIKVTVK